MVGLNESEVDGRNIVVNESQPKPAGSGGGGFKKRSFGGGARGSSKRPYVVIYADSIPVCVYPIAAIDRNDMGQKKLSAANTMAIHGASL